MSLVRCMLGGKQYIPYMSFTRLPDKIGWSLQCILLSTNIYWKPLGAVLLAMKSAYSCVPAVHKDTDWKCVKQKLINLSNPGRLYEHKSKLNQREVGK